MPDDPRVPTSSPDESDYAASKATASDYILREARDAGVRLVRCLWTDLSNIIRGRAIHVGALRPYMINGIAVPANTMGLTTTDIQAAPTLRGQIRLLPDPATFHVVQYAPGTALMLGDLYESDLQPWALCPRSFLRRMLADLTDLGLRLQVGFELECYFAVRTGEGTFYPVDESLDSSSIGMAVTSKVLHDIVNSLDEQRLQLDHFHPGQGGGQQHLIFRPVDALTACDRLVMARETIRTIAWTHGWYASFAAKPFENQPPSGLDLQLNLWDRHDKNILYKNGVDANEGEYPVGDEAGWFLGGLLKHMPALAAIACPSVNSYRRLHSSTSVPPFTAWGFDNLQTLLRLSQLTWREGGASANAQLKLADGSANPYLLLGTLIAAGLDGLTNHHPLPPSISGSPSTIEPGDRQELGIEQLPLTLQAACDLLEQDTALAAGMGALLLETYLSIKRQEIKTYEGVLAVVEMARHFWKF